MTSRVIAVIGAGRVGSALAQGWARAGHRVIIGTRNPEAHDVAAVMRSAPIDSATSPRDAALAADVVVVAVPGGAVGDVARALGPLGNRVVIDATNIVGGQGGPDGRGTAALRECTGSPHVVKAFNTTGVENMRDPRYGAVALDMFMAGDSTHGKAVAAELSRDLGFAECYDMGGDDKVFLVEALALAWINLAIVQKLGRGLGWKLLRRDA